MAERVAELEKALAQANLASMEIISDLTTQLDHCKRMMGNMVSEKTLLRDELVSCIKFHQGHIQQENPQSSGLGKLFRSEPKDRSQSFARLQDDLLALVAQFDKAYQPEKLPVSKVADSYHFSALTAPAPPARPPPPPRPAEKPHQAPVDDSSATISRITAERDHALSSLEQMKIELQRTGQEMSSVRHTLEQQQQEHTLAVSALRNELSELQSHKAALDADVARLEALAAAPRIVETLAMGASPSNSSPSAPEQQSSALPVISSSDQQDLAAQIEKLEKENLSLHQQLVRLGEEFSLLQAEMSSTCASRDDLRAKSAQNEATIESLRSDAESLRADIESLRAAALAKDAQADALVASKNPIPEIHISTKENSAPVPQESSSALDALEAEVAQLRQELEESQSNAAFHEGENAQLLSQLASLREAVVSMRTSENELLETDEGLVSALKHQVTCLEEEKLQRDQQITQLQSTFDEERLKLAGELASAQTSHQDQIASLHEQHVAEVARIEEKLRLVSTQEADEKSELTSLTSQKTTLLAELQAARSAVLEQTSKLQEIEQQHQALLAKFSAMAQSLDATKEELAQAHKDLSSQQDLFTTQQAELELLKSSNEQQSILLRSTQTDLAALQAASKAEENSLRSQMSELKIVESELTKQLNERISLLTASEAAAMQAKSRVTELEQHIQTLSEQNASIVKSLETLQNEHQELQSEKDRAASECLSKAQAIEEHLHEIASLEESWAAEKNANGQLKEKLNVVQSELNAATIKSQSVEAELKTLSEAHQVLQLESSQSKDRMQALRAELEAVSKAHFETRRECEAAKQDIYQNQETIQALRQQVSSLQSESRTLNDVNSQLQSEFRVLQSTISTLVADDGAHQHEGQADVGQDLIKKLKLKLELLQSELRSSQITLSKTQAALKDKEDELANAKLFFAQQKSAFEGHVAKMQAEQLQIMNRSKEVEDRFIKTTISNMNMVNTLNNQLQVFKTGLTKAHHERTYLRDQLNKSLKSYRDIQEQHLEDQKKKEQKRFFKSAKLKDALETKYYREFEEFEGGIRRILEALEKHIAVDSPTEGSLITIDSLGLL